MVNNLSVQNPTYNQIISLINQNASNEFLANNVTYMGIKGVSSDKTKLALYYDSPALNAQLYGPIIAINGNKIDSLETFAKELGKYNVNQLINVTTILNGKQINYQIILQENPENPGHVWLGVSFIQQSSSGVLTKVVAFLSSYKKPNIYYQPNYEAAQYLYDLLWWLMLISFSVALMNMLPVGIFDGGRFFYLTVLAITKSEKAARKSYKFLTYLFLFLLLVIIVFWIKSYF